MFKRNMSNLTIIRSPSGGRLGGAGLYRVWRSGVLFLGEIHLDRGEYRAQRPDGRWFPDAFSTRRKAAKALDAESRRR